MAAFWTNLAAAAAGGAVGAAARFALGVWSRAALPSSFPWGTFIANAAGGLAIGLAFAVLHVRAGSGASGVGAIAPSLLIAGFLGGFTTFSAFSLETVLLIESGRFGAAAIYAVGSLVVCVAAAALGLTLARAYLL